jgi:uncharacterized protein
MLSWFQALMPKEERFFDLFEQHAVTIVAGAHALRSLLDGGEKAPEHCKEIKRYENDADVITRDVLLAVRRTFITPFDRGDIRDLITVMDDTIDQMHQTAKATLLYEIRDFEALMRRISEEILRIEDEADELHDQGLSALFRTHRNSDAMEFIVGAEIYGHLEKVVDGFEDVANRVAGIVIENV